MLRDFIHGPLALRWSRLTLAHRWSRLTSLTATFMVAATVAPLHANAQPRDVPECGKGFLCLYEHVDYGHYEGEGLEPGTGLPRGQQNDFLITASDRATMRPLGRKRLSVDDRAAIRYGDRSLVNRVSSWMNDSALTYCAYDLSRNGTLIELWRMAPGDQSHWVGRAVNDRADYIAPCD